MALGEIIMLFQVVKLSLKIVSTVLKLTTLLSFATWCID